MTDSAFLTLIQLLLALAVVLPTLAGLVAPQAFSPSDALEAAPQAEPLPFRASLLLWAADIHAEALLLLPSRPAVPCLTLGQVARTYIGLPVSEKSLFSD